MTTVIVDTFDLLVADVGSLVEHAATIEAALTAVKWFAEAGVAAAWFMAGVLLWRSFLAAVRSRDEVI